MKNFSSIPLADIVSCGKKRCTYPSLFAVKEATTNLVAEICGTSTAKKKKKKPMNLNTCVCGCLPDLAGDTLQALKRSGRPCVSDSAGTRASDELAGCTLIGWRFGLKKS